MWYNLHLWCDLGFLYLFQLWCDLGFLYLFQLWCDLYFSSCGMTLVPCYLFQLWCDLGFLHFKREEFTEAHSAFSQADKILSCLSKTPPLLDRGQLNGFLLACRCLLGRGEEERDKSLSQQVEECVFGTFEEVEESEKSLSQQVEEMRIGNFEVQASLWVSFPPYYFSTCPQGVSLGTKVIV